MEYSGCPSTLCRKEIGAFFVPGWSPAASTAAGGLGAEQPCSKEAASL